MKLKQIIASILLLSLIFSCTARKNYERDPNIVEPDLYRTDLLPKDSLGIGSISWKEIFTDPVLQRHIDDALQNNLDIRIALQNIIASESYLKQSKAAYYPTLNVGPNYSFNTQSLNTQFGQIIGARRYINQVDITGNLNWEIDIWGKLAAQERAQLATYLRTVAAHQSVKSDIVAGFATGYYQLLTYDEQARIIWETIAVREQNLETTKALKEAGLLTEVAVQQSQALVLNAESLLINIEVQTELLENALSLLKGIPSQRIERTAIASQFFPPNPELGYPVSLLANRPDVKMAEYDLIRTFELTKAAHAQFYPTLRITGSTGLQSVDIDELFSVSSIFGNVVGGLLQPVFNGRQIRTQYEVSLTEQEKAYLNFRKSVLTAGQEVSDALKTFTAQDRFIAIKNQELEAYEKSVKFSQELVNYGMANYLEVLNASVNQLSTELAIANANFTKLQAGVELYRALGGGWK